MLANVMLEGEDAAGELRGVQAEAHGWRGEVVRAMERGAEALLLLPRHDERWFWALNEVVALGGEGYAENGAGAGASFVADVCSVAGGSPADDRTTRGGSATVVHAHHRRRD